MAESSSAIGSGFSCDPSGASGSGRRVWSGSVLEEGDGGAAFCFFSTLAAFFSDVFEGFVTGGALNTSKFKKIGITLQGETYTGFGLSSKVEGAEGEGVRA